MSVGVRRWRSLGGAILLVGLPVVAGFLTLPQRIPASPGRDDTGRIAGAAPSVSGVTWADARRSGTFWRMVGGFALLSACVHACVVHIPAVLVSGGATPPSVVLASASAGVALLVGRVGCGWLLDRMHAGGVATAVCAGVTCGIALLAVGPGPGASLVSAALIGLGLGAEVDLIAFLLSRYFGLRALGSTMGFAFGVFVLAGGVGPLALGVAFDRTGSYGLPLLGFATASATAGLLLSGLGPYRFLASQESPAFPTTNAGREGAIS